MAARRVQEPRSFFKVMIDGVFVGSFYRVSGLSNCIEVKENSQRPGELLEKTPGKSYCNNVILYKTRTREQPFWNWLKNIQSGKLEKKNISIELFYRGKPLRGWKLINCWPCRWSMSDITDDNVLTTTEEIELVVEDIELF